jgi:hypothetical protein
MIARGGLELDIYTPPPGDQWNIIQPAMQKSWRPSFCHRPEAEFAMESIGFFTSPRKERAKQHSIR